jgi:hypothetical protein
MIFAESNFTPPPQYVAWVAGLAFTLWLILLGFKVWDRFSGKSRERTILPNPVITQQVEQLVTVPVFGQHVTEQEARFKRMEDKREEDLRLAAQTRRAMHTDIQDIGKEVSALTAVTESQSQQLDRLDTKLDANRRELNDKLDKQLPETIATIINAKKV